MALVKDRGEGLADAAPDSPTGPTERPNILVFDSGLGGLTVFAELRAARPDGRYLYVADDAGFPYGPKDEPAVAERVLTALSDFVAAHAPDMVVIACNTASTVVLPRLRARWPDLPFVGTVPAIKPAAAVSRSKCIAVIGTPGTVARDYTRGLIEAHAADCRVILVGAKDLAALAEAEMRGESVDDAAVAREIAPCFVETAEGRTDAVVLACTHYPLLRERLERLAAWPVSWIDPAPAIARHAARVLVERRVAAVASADQEIGRFVFTSGARPGEALARALARFGLSADGSGG